ncbi:hypothetical protein F5Y19DRAFT_480898 [Xylariaceae sp. FL1651]|nr:hypothetical protein F5Y19DRAFT_480898 [Xylariaceae sp. FL1651]
MRTRSSKRKSADEIAPREKTTPLPSSAHIPADLAASSAMRSLDSTKTTASQYQRDMADTPVESIPLEKPDTALRESNDGPRLAKIKEEKMPTTSLIESTYNEQNFVATHVKLSNEIHLMAEVSFQPTPWDKLKPDDQVKLKRWTPDAKLLIESKRGYPLIFSAWIWHILDDGVFSADPKTKWQEYGDGFEAVKLLSQFIDITFQSEGTNDSNDRARVSGLKDHPRWYTSEWNKWRSVSAGLALQHSSKQRTVHSDYVAKLIDSNLGYVMIKPSKFSSSLRDKICQRTGKYDAILLIYRNKPRLVWTDPLKQDEQGVLYGFPFTNKVDPEQEIIPGGQDDEYLRVETRIETVESWILRRDVEKNKLLRTTSEGKPVQLVTSPGLVSRGWVVFRNNRSFASDWHLTAWVHPMIVVVPEMLDPPIKPATVKDGVFLPAS